MTRILSPIALLTLMTGFCLADEQVRIEKDIPFLGADREEKLDLYQPANIQPGDRFPGIVIIHGGGWRSGDKGRAREINIGTNLARSGYVCISINYVLASEGNPTWPENLYDCKRAVRFLRKNAEQYHVNPDRIGVIGGSAGGHLTAMVGVTGPDSGLDPPGPDAEISCRAQAIVPMYGVGKIEKDTVMLPGTLEEIPELYRLASPVTHVSSDDPPTLILHGTADETVPVYQSEYLAEALKQNNVEHELVIIEGAPHTFHLQPKQRDLRPVVIGFFDKHLKQK